MNSLLKETWKALKAARKPVLVGALAFTFLYTGVVSYSLNRVEQEQTAAAKTLGVNPDRIEALLGLSESGDIDAAEEMMAELQAASNAFAGMTDEERTEAFEEHSYQLLLQMMPIVITGFLLLLFVTILSCTYFMTIAVGKPCDAASLVRSTVSMVLPSIGLGFWVFIRSHAWLMFLSFLPYGFAFSIAGALCAFLFLPLYFAAPVFLLQERCSFIVAAQKSYDLSKGHWSTIVRYGITALLISLFVQFFMGVLIGSIGSTGVLEMSLGIIVRQLTLAFIIFFVVAIVGALKKKGNA